MHDDDTTTPEPPPWMEWAEHLRPEAVAHLAELDAELALYEDKLVDLGRRI
jgi:hypothetical protein